MKTKNQTICHSIFSMLFVAALIVFGAVPVNAQNSETTMQDIYEKGGAILKGLEEEYGQEIVRIEYDLVFSEKETTRNFSSDYDYSIIAFADDRVEDLDVTVLRETDNGWVVVVKDTEEDATPIVSFTPDGYSNYKIQVSVSKFAPGCSGAHYGLIISHDIPE